MGTRSGGQENPRSQYRIAIWQPNSLWVLLEPISNFGPKPSTRRQNNQKTLATGEPPMTVSVETPTLVPMFCFSTLQQTGNSIGVTGLITQNRPIAIHKDLVRCEQLTGCRNPHTCEDAFSETA